jgi:hemin uptake protein HemP
MIIIRAMQPQPPRSKPPSDQDQARDERNEGIRRVASHELLRGAGEIVIEHRGREYRLRVTQHGKLILTA